MSAIRRLGFHSFEEVIKGTVTEVHSSLLYFEVDEKYRVYPDITKDYPELPLVDCVVEIRNPKIFCHSTYTAVVGPLTECHFPSVASSETINMDLFNFLKMRRCDENELLAMDKIVRKLQKCLPGIKFSRVLKSILNVAPFKIRSLPIVDNSDRQSFESVKVEFPSQLGYVNENSKQYIEFINFIGGCYYGVHSNTSIEKVNNIVTEYLLGWLETDSMYGWFILRDDKSNIPVKFYKNLVPTNYLGKCILIKKWTVFTEIFQSNQRTCQYVLVNIRNVVIVDCPDCKIEKLFYSATEHCKRKNIIVFELTGKSEIIHGYNGHSECYLELKVLEYSDRQLNSNPFMFLALTAKHFVVVPYLRENAKYRMWYNGKLEVLHLPFYKELYKLRTAKHLYRASDDAIFQAVLNQNVADSSKYEDSHQIQNLLNSEGNKFVSFALPIARKYIQTCNFPSYIPKRHEDIPFFDIPGQNKQMVVEFSDASSTTTFKLYFNDRDNYVFPMGLIKDMRVFVRHVEIYKNNYFKTTALTSFEILEYCPKVPFSSANLGFADRMVWNWTNGKKSLVFLGMHNYLPENCIVKGSFMLLSVLNLKIGLYCIACENLVVRKLCANCNRNFESVKWKLQVKMTLFAQDSISTRFKIATEYEGLLFGLLRLTKDQIKSFCNVFSKTRQLYIDFGDNNSRDFSSEGEDVKEFLEEFCDYMKTEINYKQQPVVDAVCVKQDSGCDWKMIEFCFV